MDAPLPDYIGPYRVLRKLGEGGMGAVFEAIQQPIERHVAVKTLHPSHARNERIVARFLNEAKALGKLQHPSVVQVIDYGTTTEGMAYLVMEFLKGESLARRLKTFNERRSVLPWHATLQIGFQVADALAVAHANGIVHRDLKPDNLMLVPDAVAPGGERVKILDFGIAKLTDKDIPSVKTETQAIMGTPMYMSPEQCQGAGRVDAKTDVYSLGCVLYEALSGVPPFLGEGNGEILAKHLFQEPVPLRAIVPAVSEPIAALVHRLLTKDKSGRPSMTQAADELGTLLAGISPVAPVLRTPISQPHDPEATRPWVAPPNTLSNARGQFSGLVSVLHRRWLPLGSVALVAIGLLSVMGWYRGRTKTHPDVAAGALRATERPDVSIKSPGQPSADRPVQHVATEQKSTDPEPTQHSVPEAASQTGTSGSPSSAPNKASGSTGERSKSPHPSPSTGSASFAVSVTGAAGASATVLRSCATSELKGARGLPDSYQVKLERSGALHVVDAPPQIFHTDLSKCIRNGLKTLPVPQSVTLSIRSGR